MQYKNRKIILPELKVLTEEVAKQILRDGRIEDLLEYDKLQRKAAEVLAKYDGLLTFSGIHGNGWTDGLPDEIAHALARHKGGIIIKYLHFLGDSSGHVALAKTFANNEGVLDLRHVRELGSLAADALAQHKGGIILSSLYYLSDAPGHVALAKTLAENVGVLDLSDLRELGDFAADALAQHKGGIILKDLRSLRDSPGHAALAETIADIEGVLNLSQFEELGDSAANAFAKHKGGINVSGLRRLNDSSGHIALAKTLAENNGVLDLSRIDYLGDAAAKELANHRGGIQLRSLRSLSDSPGHVALAKTLVGNDDFIDLRHLEYLSDAAAEVLDEYKGFINLSGLRILSDSRGHVALARRLAEKEGAIDIGSLEHLGDTAAEVLAKHRGGIKLYSLCSLSDSYGHVALAKTLAENEGVLMLSGIEYLGDKAAEELAKHKGGIQLKRLRILSDSPGHVALAKTLAENHSNLDIIFLDGLTSLGDAAAIALTNREHYYLSSFKKIVGAFVARCAGKSETSLSLVGLTFLSDSAAKYLAKYNGFIFLHSQCQLSSSTGHLALRWKLYKQQKYIDKIYEKSRKKVRIKY